MEFVMNIWKTGSKIMILVPNDENLAQKKASLCSEAFNYIIGY